MKIENLKINGFGKLENKEIEFSDGINIITGKNESGKSTLLKFITSMFYGASKNKNGKLIPDFDKYKPWNTEEYSGRITYNLDNGEQYEIYREFKKKSPIIYNESKDDITKKYQIDKNKENTFFREQTGITEENFFSTSISEQENVKLSNSMKNEVIQKLSNIVTTGSESTSYEKAIEKLNKKQLEEVGNKRSVGRPINQVEEEIEKIEEEKKTVETYKNKKYQVEEEKQTLKTDLEDNEVILDLLRRQKINIEKTELEKQKNNIFKKVLEENIENQNRIQEKIKNVIEERKEDLKSNKIVYIIAIIMIIVITIPSIILKKYIMLILNIIPIISMIFYLTKKHKKKLKIKKSGKKAYQERAILEEELQRLKEDYNKKEKEIQKREEEILLEQKNNEGRITIEFLNKIDQEIIEDILSTKYENIVEFIDEKEREKAEYKITEKTIEVDNENIIKKLEDLVEMDEKLENLYEKKDDLLQLNNMYEMAKEEIQNAYQEIKENITPEFMEELKNILSDVTNGKYNEAYLDSENNILIETENGKYMPVEMLSTGTIDLIYLALRISAVKEITKENMPIVLDESFAYYDDERMTKILEYLSKINEHQILIFTCSEREKNILKEKNIQHKIIEI